MKTNDEVHGHFVWAGWFSLLAGLLVLGLLPMLRAGFADIPGWSLMVLAGMGALAALTRGWLMLSLAIREERGAWPAWGLFQLLPWIVATFAVATGLSVGALAGWWVGGPFEASMLQALPIDLGGRGALAKAGYVVPFAAVAWRAPTLWAKAAQQARTFVRAASSV